MHFHYFTHGSNPPERKFLTLGFRHLQVKRHWVRDAGSVVFVSPWVANNQQLSLLQERGQLIKDMWCSEWIFSMLRACIRAK